MKLSDIAVRRPITTVMFFSAIVLLGLVSVSKLSMQILPSIAPPYGAARVFLSQNMSIEELEREVLMPVEGMIAQLPHVRNFRTHSRGGRGAFFFIEFEFGTNVRYQMVDLQDKLDQFKNSFSNPRNVNVRAFPFDTDWANKELMDLVLKSPRSDPYIEAIDTEKIRQRLADIDGVANSSIWGGKRRSVDVAIFQDRLTEFGVPMWRVINQVQSYASEPVFLGDIEDKNQKYFVRLDGQFKSTSEIEDVVVREEGNIALRHLGEANDVFRSRRYLRRVDGKPALGVDVEKEALVNPIELSNRTRKVIDQINEELPEGYVLEVVWDSADEILYLIRTLSRLALMGVILSMVVLYLFIRNLRMAMIICVVIPICIIATFNAMYFSEMSINIVSLLGLAVGVGCLIDSSIVMLENIFRHHERGRGAIFSSQLGSREVGMAVFALTITNVLVFLPIVFVEGRIRLMFTEGALAIIYPMVISMLVALTLVPMAMSRMLIVSDKKKALEQQAIQNGQPVKKPLRKRILPASLVDGFQRLPKPSMAAVRHYYSGLLKSCLRHRVRFLLAIIVVIAYTYSYQTSQVGKDVMQEPEDDRWFNVHVYLPSGTQQDYTIGVVDRVEDMLLDQVPEAKNIHSWVREDYARIRIYLKESTERARQSATIQEELRPYMEQFTEAEVTFNYSRSRGEEEAPPVSTGRGGEIEIRGPEYGRINLIANNLAEVLSQIEGIRDVVSQNEPGSLEVHFRLDKNTANFLQITPSTVAQSIQVAQRRGDVTSFQMKKGDEEIDIVFSQIEDRERYSGEEDADEEGLKFEELEKIPIYSASLGSTVDLEDVGTFDIQRGMANFQRENRERIGRIEFNTAPTADYRDVEEVVRNVIDSYPVPAGYRVSLGGMSRTFDEGVEAVRQIILLAVILIYMCIASLFESFSQPLVIMLAIPLAIVGIIWALIITGTPFTELAGLGCIFLVGMLPNSAILLVHFAAHLRRERKYTRERAVMTSGFTRLRPIFMTVLTTCLGLTPMALSWRGDEEWVPFAVTVIGGLLSATILTLVIVPGFYFIIEDIATLITRSVWYILSFRWIFIFWSKELRLKKKQELTAYRMKPPREEPLQIEIDHLTRIYQPTRLEVLSKTLAHYYRSIFKPAKATGFIAETPGQVSKQISTQNRNKALDMFSLDIGSGLFGLLGPNGAGKTTLLRLLAGIDQPTRGYLSICGYDMKKEANKARKLIGYLPQHFGIYSTMSAYQYLEYFALMKGLKEKKERKQAIEQALEWVNLSDQASIPVGQFSGGMMRRIGLAQIFLSPPKVLIVDEPTAGLDPMERVRFRNLLSRMARDRVVILSTHIVEDVAHACNQMALMNHGKLLFRGEPEELMGTAQGKVWEVEVPESMERWREIRSKYIVASQSHTEEGIRMRIVSESSPDGSAREVFPTLEDAYLYHIHLREE